MPAQFAPAEAVPHLVALPPVESFRSLRDPRPPCQGFLDFVAREVGLQDVEAHQVFVPVAIYAALREATRAWAKGRNLLGHLDAFTAQGVTAPIISSRVPGGHAIVEVMP